jgi:hypothetical protein
MKKQVSPMVLIAVMAVVMIALGAVYFRQFVYAAPTPHPKLYSSGGQSTAGPTNPGR